MANIMALQNAAAAAVGGLGRAGAAAMAGAGGAPLDPATKKMRELHFGNMPPVRPAHPLTRRPHARLPATFERSSSARPSAQRASPPNWPCA